MKDDKLIVDELEVQDTQKEKAQKRKTRRSAPQRSSGKATELMKKLEEKTFYLKKLVEEREKLNKEIEHTKGELLELKEQLENYMKENLNWTTIQ